MLDTFSTEAPVFDTVSVISLLVPTGISPNWIWVGTEMAGCANAPTGASAMTRTTRTPANRAWRAAGRHLSNSDNLMIAWKKCLRIIATLPRAAHDDQSLCSSRGLANGRRTGQMQAACQYSRQIRPIWINNYLHSNCGICSPGSGSFPARSVADSWQRCHKTAEIHSASD